MVYEITQVGRYTTGHGKVQCIGCAHFEHKKGTATGYCTSKYCNSIAKSSDTQCSYDAYTPWICIYDDYAPIKISSAARCTLK